MNIIKGVIDKVASRKLAVTAAAATCRWLLWPRRISLVRLWWMRLATEAWQRRKKSGTAVRAAPILCVRCGIYDEVVVAPGLLKYYS